MATATSPATNETTGAAPVAPATGAPSVPGSAAGKPATTATPRPAVQRPALGRRELGEDLRHNVEFGFRIVPGVGIRLDEGDGDAVFGGERLRLHLSRRREVGGDDVEALAGEPDAIAALAVRHDIFSRFRDATSLRASTRAELGGGWSLAASYGEGIAQPTFF